MIYERFIECLDLCNNHIDEGGGKITNVVLRDFILPDNIKELIKENHIIVRNLVVFYYNDFTLRIPYYNSPDEILNSMEFIKIKSNENKEKFIKFNKILFEWLKTTDFFSNIYNNFYNIINPDDIKSINFNNNIKLRDNQIEAFKKLDNNGLETGIHCQATGCGKSYIIIKYIHYTNKIINNPKIILFTERVNILSDLFSFKKNSIKVDNKKLEHWKNIGIGDLTNFNIINRVTIKKNDWIELLKESNKPTLLVINRAYLTLGKLYNKLDNNDLHLILHDECHNTSSIQCHDLLLKCHSLNIPIIGFSATPLRTGNDDKIKLLEIYSKVNNKNELNLLTDYNMIYAIDKELILPPEFYWYQIESYNKKKDNIISQEDLGSVLEILNHIIPLLPNKKIIAWCGTINRAKNWKTLFESNYKQRKNLKNFKFGIDTSESNTNDYDNFSKESNNHEMYNGYSILFCASKHREGSDIPLLDCCIFLDEVKNRGAIPFIQSIGRVLRTSENKTKGIIIDGIVKDNNNYDKEFVDKIIGYYMALENLTTNDKTKYEQYIELKDIVQFDKEKEIINMKLGLSIINIHCNKLDWNNIINKFDNILLQKIKLSDEDKDYIDFNQLKQNISQLNFINKQEYYDYASENNLELKPEIKYNKYWINWYNFLGTDITIFPENKKEWLKYCKEYKIIYEKKYMKKYMKYNLPSMPEELYKEFGIIDNELKKNIISTKKKIDL